MDISRFNARSAPTQRQDWQALNDGAIDPARELDAVTSSLLVLRMEDSHGNAGSADDLIELHAALLMYQLAGRAELLPATGFALFSLWSIERRIVRAASRIAGPGRGDEAAFAAWRLASERVELLIGLIDPDLWQLVA